MLRIIFVIFLVFFVTSCDVKKNKQQNGGKGNYVIVNNDATLYGKGYIRLKGVEVLVQNHKIFVNGDSFGSIPHDATTLLHVYDDGTFVVYVNGEQRYYQTRDKNNIIKQNKKNDRKRLNLNNLTK